MRSLTVALLIALAACSSPSGRAPGQRSSGAHVITVGGGGAVLSGGTANDLAVWTGANTIGTSSSFIDMGTAASIVNSSVTVASTGTDTINLGNGASDVVKVTGQLQLLGAASPQLSVSGTVNLSGTSVTVGSTSTTVHIAQVDTSQRPTLTSCGTSPSIIGNDAAGIITTGTGATACTVTWHTAYGSNYGCTVTARDGTARAYALTTTTLTLSAATAGGRYDYVCFDH